MLDIFANYWYTESNKFDRSIRQVTRLPVEGERAEFGSQGMREMNEIRLVQARERNIRNTRLAYWRGPRARRWYTHRQHRSETPEEPRAPVLAAAHLRRCGNSSDMVRACTLVQSWYDGPAKQVSKAVLDWIHPVDAVAHCEVCNRLYLAVQRYFMVWISAKLEGPPLPRQYAVPSLEGDKITEAELRRVVEWVCDHLGERIPSEDEDLPPAA